VRPFKLKLDFIFCLISETLLFVAICVLYMINGAKDGDGKTSLCWFLVVLFLAVMIANVVKAVIQIFQYCYKKQAEDKVEPYQEPETASKPAVTFSESP
jgi:hypothetical protein